MGRKSVPTVLKELRGNPGRRPIPEEELEGVGDLWSPPTYMDDEQRKQWDYVLAHAPPGLLTGTDRGIVAAYVNAIVEYERALVQVRSMGQVVKTKDGNAIQNPFLGIMNRQAVLMTKFGSDLGFSPAARASLGSRAPEFTHDGPTGRGRTHRNALDAYIDASPDKLNS